jgi:hypothetical protein
LLCFSLPSWLVEKAENVLERFSTTNVNKYVKETGPVSFTILFTGASLSDLLQLVPALAQSRFKFGILLSCSRMDNIHYFAAHLWVAGLVRLQRCGNIEQLQVVYSSMQNLRHLPEISQLRLALYKQQFEEGSGHK